MLNSLINLDLKREDLELKTRIYGNLQTIRNSLDAQFGQFIKYCSFSTTLSDTEVECIFFEDSNYSIDRLSDVLETLTICKYVFISTGFKTKFKNIIQTFANSDYYLEHEGAFFSLFYKRQLIVQKNTTRLHSSEFNEDFLFSGIPRVDKIFLRKAAKSGGVFRTPAIEFLKVKRFDIAAKCLYGRLWTLGWAENWRNLVFWCHLNNITGGRFTEHSSQKKEGYSAYKRVFQGLIKNVDYNSVAPVLSGKDKILMDGSHRVASAITNNRPILSLAIDETFKGYSYTDALTGKTKVPQIVMDDIALEYCRMKPGIFVALVFPSAGNSKKAIKILKETSEVVYQSSRFLRPKAAITLIKQIYGEHVWFKQFQGEIGIQDKAKKCFPTSGVVTMLLLDSASPKEILLSKQKIRDVYGIGNDSIHITDGNFEALQVARIMLNENSLKLLDCNLQFNKRFLEMVSNFKVWVAQSNENIEDFCIGGSALLDPIGVRINNDLDVLYAGKTNIKDFDCPKSFGFHNDIIGFYPYSASDIAGDPRLHCWLFGVKFCNIDVVMEMKKNRGEQKDKKDVKLLKVILDQRLTVVSKLIRFYFFFIYYSYFLRLYHKATSSPRSVLSSLKRVLFRILIK